MRKLFRPHVARVTRSVLAFSLLAILLVIVGYFLIHWRQEPRIRSDKKREIIQQKIDVKEKVQYFEFKGEKGKIQISADKNYVGEDNLYHLEGQVKIVDYGRRGSHEIRATGEKVIYDQKQNHFWLQGRVRIKYKDFSFESDVLEYDRQKEIFQCETGIHFTSGRFTGFARKMSYSTSREDLTLENDLWIEMRPRIEKFKPLLVKGHKVTYNLREGKGTVEGEVSLAHGESRGTADRVEFEQCFPEEDDLKVLLLKGRVKIFLKEKREQPEAKKNSLPDDDFIFFESEEQEIEAEEVKVRAFLFLPLIHAVESTGNCSFKFISSSGRITSIQGEAVDFIFSREGILREFRAFDKAKIAGSEKGKAEGRIVEGEAIRLDGWTKILHIQGKESVAAKLTSKESDVSAEELALYLENGDYEARGRVKTVFYPKKEEKESVGFFSRKKPVYILAQTVRYLKEQKRFIFQEKTRMWQEKEMLEAQEVSFSEETGEMRAEGQVKSVFHHRPKEEEKEERVEVSANKMSFDPKANLICYEEDCFLKTRSFTLRSLSLSISPSEEKAKVKTILAKKKVVILQDNREATGEEALYDIDQDTIVLSGNPVLVEKGKGVVRGEKLTFHLGDGRIRVENRDQERSLTIIKS